jgi:hypothetical protein
MSIYPVFTSELAQKSDRALPYLWVSENIQGIDRFRKYFQLVTLDIKPEAEYNIIALKDEASIRQAIRKIQHFTPTANIRIFPGELLQFETETNVLMKSQEAERWLEITKNNTLDFPQAQTIARGALQSLNAGEISRTQWNIEKEELRQRCGLSGFDWNNTSLTWKQKSTLL